MNLLKNLNTADDEYLKKNIKKVNFVKGEIIFSPSDQCKNLSIVLKGQIKLCKYSAQGREQIISFIAENDVFGEALVFNEAHYPVFVVAETNCSIGMIDKATILEMTLRDKDFTRQFFEELSKKIMMLNHKVELLSFSNIKQRLAFYLIKLSMDAGHTTIEIPFSKQKIANLLSTSREVISRNFSDMENEGYIEMVGKKVKINMEQINKLLE